MLGQIATGIDPIAEKRAEKMRQITLNDVFNDYIHVRKWLKHNTLYNYKKVLATVSLAGLINPFLASPKRRQQAATLRWDQVDLNAKTLTVLDTKNHESHTLPLSSYLYELLLSRSQKGLTGMFFLVREQQIILLSHVSKWLM